MKDIKNSFKNIGGVKPRQLWGCMIKIKAEGMLLIMKTVMMPQVVA